MPTLNQIIDVYTEARDCSVAAVSRLQFWRKTLGDRPLTEITPDEVAAARTTLIERGALVPHRNSDPTHSGRPLKNATVNRYLSELAGVFKFARREGLAPLSFIPPTRGVWRLPEEVDPNRYLRPEEVERLLKFARVYDQRWKKLPAFIVVAYQTGLRKSNVLNLRWRDVDLDAGTIHVSKTKNGSPMTSVITSEAIEELRQLPGSSNPDALVFANREGRLWVANRYLPPRSYMYKAS